MRKTLIAITTLSLLVASGPAEAGRFSRWLKKIRSDEVTEEKVVSGLKEALRIGSENSVLRTGVVGGFLDNEQIRIGMPDKLQGIEKALRKIGFDRQLDDFVRSMNRAAETAAPQAKQIFGNAIRDMSFEDARGILKGGETAATDYFRGKTSDSLTTAFTPVVEGAMSEVGLSQKYDELLDRASALPFVKRESLDLDDYIVTRSLDGLFLILGEEERKIREDPAARVTDLLREVFK